MSNRKTMWDKRYSDKSADAPGLPGFLLSWLPRLQDGRLLDLASGDGAVALNLPDRFEICAVDFSAVALHRLEHFAALKALEIETCEIDLDTLDGLQSLGKFQSIIICRYKPSYQLLQRLQDLLHPGGSVLIATFNRQHHLNTGFPERLTLAPEQLSAISGFRLIDYFDGAAVGDSVDIYLHQKLSD